MSPVFDSNIVFKDGNLDTLVQLFNTHCSQLLEKVAALVRKKDPLHNTIPTDEKKTVQSFV